MKTNNILLRKYSKQREIILDILKGTKSHPTADWVYEQAKKVIPGISLGTVYRNLKILKEDGKILELNFANTFCRYDGNPAHHYHFTCEKCRSVMDVEGVIDSFVYINEAVSKDLNAKILSHRIEFYGICKDCVVLEM